MKGEMLAVSLSYEELLPVCNEAAILGEPSSPVLWRGPKKTFRTIGDAKSLVDAGSTAFSPRIAEIKQHRYFLAK
jgi:hypothetical protein